MKMIPLFQRETPLTRFLALSVASGLSTEAEATGNPATFSTELQKPLKSFVVPFTPVQAGSGDPSPSNIRNISGIDSFYAFRTGKNLFGEQTSGVINAYFGEKIASANSSFKTVFTFCNPNTTYTVSKTAGARFVVGYTKEIPENKVPVYGVISNNTASSITITTGADAAFLVAFIYNGSYDTITAEEMIASVQIEVGDRASTFEPFDGDYYHVEFPDGQTIYGGTLDIVSGVLTVEWLKLNLSERYFDYYDTASGHLFRTTVIQGWDAKSNSTDFFVNTYKITTQAQRTNLTASVSADGRLDIIDDDYSDRDSFKAALAEMGAVLVYHLATPQTIQLDPVTIQTLIGNNTVWTDTNGTNTVVYLKKK